MRVGKPVAFIVAIVVVIICYISAFGYSTFVGDKEVTLKSAKDIRLGIDIKGGFEAYFQAKDSTVKPTEAELESVRAILERRMDSKNIADREISIDNENGTVLVRVPWKQSATDQQTALEELGATAKLTFVASDTNEVILEGKDVSKATAEIQDGAYVVSLEFNAEGTTAFSEATTRLYNGGTSSGSIAIMMDDETISSPTVNASITDGKAIIEGIGGATEAKELAATIAAGSLPFDIETKSFSNISPTLGGNALNIMIQAGLLAFILICIFMILYYRLPGFVACLGLAAQAAISIIVLAVTGYTLTLPGIAGIILTLGMGVDTNVIIAERIREELRAGKTYGTAIEAGYHRAYSAIVDGNLTTLIVALLLFWFGSGSMKSFGFTLGVGVALNFITGVTLSHLMVTSLSRFDAFRKRIFYGGAKKEAVSK